MLWHGPLVHIHLKVHWGLIPDLKKIVSPATPYEPGRRSQSHPFNLPGIMILGSLCNGKLKDKCPVESNNQLRPDLNLELAPVQSGAHNQLIVSSAWTGPGPVYQGCLCQQGDCCPQSEQSQVWDPGLSRQGQQSSDCENPALGSSCRLLGTGDQRLSSRASLRWVKSLWQERRLVPHSTCSGWGH